METYDTDIFEEKNAKTEINNSTFVLLLLFTRCFRHYPVLAFR